MAEQEMKTQIKIGPAIGSYANIFKPRAVNEGDEPKYSISLLFDKKSAEKQLAELKRVIAYVAAKKFGPNWQKLCKKIPIHDGDVDKPEQKEYAGKLFVNCSSTRQPGIVNRHLVPVTTEEDAYSGCLYVAAVNVFAFDHKVGGKGVSLGLNNLLVWEKGERIDGKKDASEDFAEYAEGGATPAATGSDDASPLD